MNNSGIYCVYNITNGKFYIGSAMRFNRRFVKHQSELKRNVHGNAHMQRAYNRYGNIFEYYIIEYVEPIKEKLLEREQWWIDISNCNDIKIGYNLRKTAKSNLDLKWSEETKFKMGAHVRGIKRSEEYKKKMSEVKKGLVKSPEWQAKINASPNLGHRRDKNKWPHDGGNKCNCEECKNKKKTQKLEKEKEFSNYIMVDLKNYNWVN